MTEELQTNSSTATPTAQTIQPENQLETVLYENVKLSDLIKKSVDYIDKTDGEIFEMYEALKAQAKVTKIENILIFSESAKSYLELAVRQSDSKTKIITAISNILKNSQPNVAVFNNQQNNQPDNKPMQQVDLSHIDPLKESMKKEEPKEFNIVDEEDLKNIQHDEADDSILVIHSPGWKPKN